VSFPCISGHFSVGQRQPISTHLLFHMWFPHVGSLSFILPLFIELESTTQEVQNTAVADRGQPSAGGWISTDHNKVMKFQT